jgi:pimeloyl-ACP methyl ester carboxylesterase
LTVGCTRAPTLPANLDASWGERRTFAYQGLKINYYEAGQGPPVILVHGFGASAYSWRFLGPALASDHRVFTLDLKGFGMSEKPADGKYAVTDQADLVAAFIRTLDLHDLVVVGHSMGGGVALMTYFKVREDAPARIRKIVLIDSAGYPQKLPRFIRFARIPLVNTLITRLLPPRCATYLVLKKCYYDAEKITDEQIDVYAYYGTLPGAREVLVETAKQLVPDNFDALTARYQTIQVPVLLVWGEDDQVVPISVGKNFQRDIPNSELVILPQCGHMPPEEEAEETARVVKEFLKKWRLLSSKGWAHKKK